MDTRESGPWIAAEMAGGLARRGVEVQFAGVATTPGIAYLARTGPFAAGVMISASHNPYQDNGIKIIDHSGYKLADSVEERLEADLFRDLEQGEPASPATLTVDETLDHSYLDHLAEYGSDFFRRAEADCGLRQRLRFPPGPQPFPRNWAPPSNSPAARPTAATSI